MTAERQIELETTSHSWRRGMFRPAAEGALRRRTRDWFGLFVGIALLIVTSLHHGDVTRSERAVFDLFNTLPGALAPLFRSLYRLGALWAVGLVVVAALVAGRRRLARDLVLAGVLAWGSARALGEIVDAHESIAHSLRIAVGFGGSPSAYPSARVAIIVAVIVAAAPYVTRPARVLRVADRRAPGRIGAVPRRRVPQRPRRRCRARRDGRVPGAPRVRVTRHAPDHPADHRRARPSRSRGSRRALRHRPTDVVDARARRGRARRPLRIRVVGRDDAHHQLLAKLWTSLVNKGSTSRFVLTREQQVEHEAYLMLVAAQAEVHVPTVVVAGRAGPRAALLVQRPVDRHAPGRPRRRSDHRRAAATPLDRCRRLGTRAASCTVTSTPTT